MIGKKGNINVIVVVPPRKIIPKNLILGTFSH
jgi:hypothetical protein